MQQKNIIVKKIVYPKSTEQLIERLKLKDLKICDVNSAKEILFKMGYSSIKKYRTPVYDNKTKKYIYKSSIEDIYKIYEFDMDLKMLFLKYFLSIENLFRDSYNFLVYYKINSKNAMARNNFDCSKNKNNTSNFNDFKMSSEKNAKNRVKWIAMYINEGYEIPSWLLFDSFNMGFISKYYDFLDHSLKKEISKYISDKRNIFIKNKWILSFLKSLTCARNLCVHNEPLFSNVDYEIMKDSVKKFMPLYSKKNKNEYEQCGSIGLFSYVIIFKYLLSKKEFEDFFKGFINILKKFKKNISKQIFRQVVAIMKIPSNYKKIVSMDVNNHE